MTHVMGPEQMADIAKRAYQFMTPWSAAQFAQTLSHSRHVLACSDHAFVLGQVVLDEAEILGLATDPDYQRSGQARHAMDRFVQKIRTQGARSCFLEVAEHNRPAIAFYRNYGFSAAGSRKNYYRQADGTYQHALIMSANTAHLIGKPAVG